MYFQPPTIEPEYAARISGWLLFAVIAAVIGLAILILRYDQPDVKK